MEIAEIALQLLPVLLLRNAVDAYRRILAEPMEGALQRSLIDEVRQRVKDELRVLRSLHYLEKLG